MEICTIGFTKRSAADFFGTLREAGVRRLIDVRLNNRSQLAGFAKRDDLAWFLAELCDADYTHQPALAPDDDLLKAYRSGDVQWSEYEKRFLDLMRERHIESSVDWGMLLDRRAVLLCSEPDPEHCHRRLVVEYLNDHGLDLTSIHL